LISEIEETTQLYQMLSSFIPAIVGDIERNESQWKDNSVVTMAKDVKMECWEDGTDYYNPFFERWDPSYMSTIDNFDSPAIVWV